MEHDFRHGLGVFIIRISDIRLGEMMFVCEKKYV